MAFVVDASVTLAWCLPDEDSNYADRVLGRFAGEMARVPPVWALEVANALAVATRRGRRNEAGIARAAALPSGLPITSEPIGIGPALDRVYTLSIEHNLSAYDAAYLDLAMREALPLATEDARLVAAATAAGVSLVP